ncbi:MAG TPA: membrane protein insertase YidC [Dissulfurispiraceae bacterium]|nr:membrane protein insertase YidC [Dissulfurispiraceae bacterium]
MEKRTLLAIALSIAILLVYQYFFLKPAASPVAGSGIGNGPAREAVKQASATPAALIPKVDVSEAEREVVVDNDLYTATLSSMGGAIKSILLKHYNDENGKPIVLKGDDVLPPFSLGANDGFQFAHAPFLILGGNVMLTPQVNTASIAFDFSDKGISIRRTYTFHYDNYAIDLKDEVNGLPSYWITLGKDFGIYNKESSRSVHFGPVILKDADRLEFSASKVKEPKVFKEGVKWIAQEDKYFFSSLIPKEPVEEVRVWDQNAYALVAAEFKGGTNNYMLYAGPKENNRLQQYHVGLEYVIDFGFFSIIARPLFWVLKLFYKIFHNYGVAIVILTTIVRIPFIPLVSKGQQSMKKLQDIQPRMAEIKEKYKNDPQRMQREVMELYKKHKVNPMGGCLPMVLQIPVFFALYKVLLISIELRGAPFIFWIHDLSSKDPSYVLPVVMGITMVIQQKMTPSSMEPAQQKMMMIMPVVFTFMFLSFPSGLVLYWLVNNLLSIGQQFYTNRKLVKKPA